MEEIFKRFVELQESGAINMIDVKQGAKLIDCTEKEYKDILFNYSKYKEEYL